MPNPDEVLAELGKVQNSDPFVRSQRIKRLLEFLVKSALEGNQDLLKESLIGVEVFDRAPTYDCKQDPVVRVEMRRLRSKLSEYYLNEGKADEVLIWLEKGSYVPAISKRAADAPLAVPPPPPGHPAAETGGGPAGETVAEVSPHASKPRRVPLALVVGAFAIPLIAAGLIVYSGAWTKAPQAPRVVPLVGNAGLETSPAFSPDGQQVAYSWDGNRKNFDIYVKSVEGGTAHRLTDNAAHDIDPTWSPDGRQIAFLRVFPDKTAVLSVPSVGGMEKVIAQVPRSASRWHPEEPEQNGAGGPAWSSDGSYLLVTGSPAEDNPRGILRIYLDGRQERLTSPPLETTDLCPKISPSGQYIAFSRQWGAGAFDLYVMPSRGGPPVRLTTDSHSIQGLAWLDDRNLIYSSNRGGNYHLWQISRSGGPSLPYAAGGSQPRWPALSRDGHLLAFVESVNDAGIWRFPLSTNRQAAVAEPFIVSAAEDSSPEYSPDGKKIAFVSHRSGTGQIWVADADGLSVHQLTDFKGPSVGSPHWSPDSRRLVFDGGLNHQTAIWLIDADGSNQHRLNNVMVNEYAPTWSRDGRWIYFCSLRTGQDRIWKQRPDTGEAVQLTQLAFIDPRESADGRTLYLQRQSLWQMPVAGGAPEAVPELANFFLARYWNLAGDTVYFVRQDELLHKLESFNLTTRKFQEFTVIPNQLLVGTPGISVDPDRHWLLFVQRSQRRSTIMLQQR